MAPAQHDHQLGFPTKGSLKRFGFARLMAEIARERLTGSLYLLSGETKKVVFFEAGQPVFVRSNVLSECLGQILAREGLITQEQCEQTLEAIRRTGKKQGELLVEMGILSQGNLRYALRAQLRAKLLDVFNWTDGRYQFKLDDALVAFAVRLATTSAEFVFEAVRTTYSLARAQAELSEHDARYPMLRNRFIDLNSELLPEEVEFVWSLDGSRTLREVLSRPHPGVDHAPTLLFALLEAGLAVLADEPHHHSQSQPILLPPEPAEVRPDEDFIPEYQAQNAITEYEDTPLPGELPQARNLPEAHEADFAGVDDDDTGAASTKTDGVRPAPSRPPAVDDDDANAAFEEPFEDGFEEADFELMEDDLELTEDFTDLGTDVQLPSSTDEAVPANPTVEASSVQPLEPEALAAELVVPDDLALAEDDLQHLLALAPDADLLSFDELDQVDLGADAASQGPDPEPYNGSEATAEDVPDAEMVGALRFSEAEGAMAVGHFASAVTLLEAAYAQGFDVAELHAMLAYARFMAAGQDMRTAQHAFDLLDYAENMDPSLDLIHAYRGAIFQALRQPARARAAFDRALELNPYCELAISMMDPL